MTASRLDDEHDLLAAEHALGVLHGAELTRARELVLASPEFAEAVDDWRHTLAPIADEVSELPPRPGVWVAIEHALAGAAGEPEKLVSAAPEAAHLERSFLCISSGRCDCAVVRRCCRQTALKCRQQMSRLSLWQTFRRRRLELRSLPLTVGK
jgi:hypothetical protein